MADGDRQGGAQDEVEAVDFGPYVNDWLRESAIKVARLERHRDEATLVVMGEGDDNARNS
jgi:hypothetical protein